MALYGNMLLCNEDTQVHAAIQVILSSTFCIVKQAIHKQLVGRRVNKVSKASHPCSALISWKSRINFIKCQGLVHGAFHLITITQFYISAISDDIIVVTVCKP